jgi:hypothetical protein
MNKKIKLFAEEMQKELKANESKGNWEEFININEILIEFEYHKAKLIIELRKGDKTKCKEYIADCANILLMLGNAGQLYN